MDAKLPKNFNSTQIRQAGYSGPHDKPRLSRG